jgi:hypothetical protein
MSTNVTNANPNLTAFLTAKGIDFVLRANNVQHRSRIDYAYMKGTLDGRVITVDLTDSDDTLAVEFAGLNLELKLQAKGHYFSWLQTIEKADAVDISEARQLLRNAIRAKAKTSKADQPAML